MYKLEDIIGLRQFNVIKEHFFKGINRHFFRDIRGCLFNVIRGHSPANLDCRIASGNDICCSGRSMIEMLGVLAIIGVLSVGGIAGYSKAMEKWKINKTIEQIEEITQNILTLYANQKTLDFGLEEDVYMVKVDNLKTLGIIPANLKQAERDYLFINPLGGTSYIWADHYNSFEIYVQYISKEACVALSTHNWNFSSPYFLGIVAVNKAGNSPASDYCISKIDSQEGRYGGDGFFLACKCARTTTPEFGLPVPPEVAAKACSCKSNVCEFNITYSLTGVEDPETCGKDIDWD